MKMTEVEIDLRQKGFTAFLDEEKGDFKDEKLGKKFKWVRKFEKVELGCFLPDNKSATPGDSNSQQNSGMNDQIFGLVKTFFENAIRKILVDVEWEESGKKQKVTLALLYVDWKNLPQGP